MPAWAADARIALTKLAKKVVAQQQLLLVRWHTRRRRWRLDRQGDADQRLERPLVLVLCGLVVGRLDHVQAQPLGPARPRHQQLVEVPPARDQPRHFKVQRLRAVLGPVQVDENPLRAAAPQSMRNGNKQAKT